MCVYFDRHKQGDSGGRRCRFEKGIVAFTKVSGGAAMRLTLLSTGLGLFLSLSENHSTPATGMSPPTLSRLSHHKGSVFIFNEGC